MKRVLLISEKQIKDNSIIEQNVDAKILSKTIANVQEVVLKPILGSSVYATLIDEAYNKATDSSYVIAEPYSALLTDYIQPFLINAVLVEFIVVNNYKVTNKGLLKLRDNLADNVDADELEYAKNYHENYLSKYKKNLIDFLKANNLLSCSSDTDITSNSIGWFLGGSKPASSNSSSVSSSPVQTSEQWLIDKPDYYTKTETDSALDNKSDVGHTHPISEVNDLQSVLDDKSDVNHGHSISDVTNLQTSLDNKSDVGHGHIVDDITGLQGVLDSYIPLSQKAANNGVATLDVGGKVPLSQLPSTLMIYKGTWDASTNSPSLTDGTGTSGWTYRVSVDGSQDLGSGSISFTAGDYIIYNGTAWEKSDGTDAVTSVNGQQGVVSLTAADVDALSIANAVDIGSTQTITGVKTFTANLWLNTNNQLRSNGYINIVPTSDVNISVGTYRYVHLTGGAGGMLDLVPDAGIIKFGHTSSFPAIKRNGAGIDIKTGDDANYSAIQALSFIKSGGTSSQFLKADGSIDSNSYLTVTGNAATATLASNSTKWDGHDFPYHLTSATSPSWYGLLMYNSTAARPEWANADAVRNYIGLNTSNWVPVNGNITINGNKTFSNAVTAPRFIGGLYLTGTTPYESITGNSTHGVLIYSNDQVNTNMRVQDSTGNTYIRGQVYVGGNGYNSGTQLLTTTSAASTYLPLAGGTLTGNLIGTNATFNSSITASSFIKSGGTSSQVLMADGSVSSFPATPETLYSSDGMLASSRTVDADGNDFTISGVSNLTLSANLGGVIRIQDLVDYDIINLKSDGTANGFGISDLNITAEEGLLYNWTGGGAGTNSSGIVINDAIQFAASNTSGSSSLLLDTTQVYFTTANFQVNLDNSAGTLYFKDDAASNAFGHFYMTMAGRNDWADYSSQLRVNPEEGLNFIHLNSTGCSGSISSNANNTTITTFDGINQSSVSVEGGAAYINGGTSLQLYSGGSLPVTVIDDMGVNVGGTIDIEAGDINFNIVGNRHYLRPYKIYLARLNQSGTSAPTATVFENNTGLTVTWSRVDIGHYVGTFSSSFDYNKTVGFWHSGQLSNTHMTVGENGYTNNIIEVYTSGDSQLQNIDNSIEIRIYY